MKILIIRFSSIGDIALTSPVIRCLKNQLANSEVHYLTKNTFKQIIESNPYVSKTYGIEEDVSELKRDMKVVKAAVTSTNKQVRDHERRITKLEATV